MPNPECKVYSDGSHYVAIPHTTRRFRPRKKVKEERITVKPPTMSEDKAQETAQTEAEQPVEPQDDLTPIERIAKEGTPILDAPSPAAVEEEKPNGILNEYGEPKVMTRRELFDETYAANIHLKPDTRKAKLYEVMRPYFKTDDAAKLFVENNYARKKRNVITRRIRMSRKANLHREFNFFLTFTYDDKKQTEDSFRKRLIKTLSLFSSRKDWKYIGVWERGGDTDRLHFHGIFHIPEGTMPGMLCEVTEYNPRSHQMETRTQNTYFYEKFGRCTFDEIVDRHRIGEALAYIMKYIEKDEGRIVYSKGLPQYFISDIMDDDVVCPIGLEDKKLLLFDDFTCWDEGEYVGTVSVETIARLRKSN